MWRNAMKLKYTYVIDDGFYVGRLDDYPEYTTQGETLADFEDALREIYGWILDGTLEVKEHKGILEVAG
jgi:predicted RNase H-like HicB family nuclease